MPSGFSDPTADSFVRTVLEAQAQMRASIGLRDSKHWVDTFGDFMEAEQLKNSSVRTQQRIPSVKQIGVLEVPFFKTRVPIFWGPLYYIVPN